MCIYMHILLWEGILTYGKHICLMEVYMCLPNLLAGGLPAGALPGLALAAIKSAQHMHATQKSTAHGRHTQ